MCVEGREISVICLLFDGFPINGDFFKLCGKAEPWPSALLLTSIIRKMCHKQIFAQEQLMCKNIIKIITDYLIIKTMQNMSCYITFTFWKLSVLDGLDCVRLSLIYTINLWISCVAYGLQINLSFSSHFIPNVPKHTSVLMNN